jgi:catechol 2,3-dioxygenase-like lactoylglutathione lyase family enzyme
VAHLNLTRSGIENLLADTTWYRLLIPETELALDSFEKVRMWQELAQALLRKYVERYYGFRKREWELPHLEYRDIGADDPNFPCIVRDSGPEYGYRILIEDSQQEIIEKLSELKAAIEAGDLRAWEFGGIEAISFGRHLYQPLLSLEGGAVEISPAPLNAGERRFVEDLKAFHDANPGYFAERELYLLRNLSKGRGVGFFEAGNFHPDFLVWQLEGDRQRVAFVDPKGIRNVGLQDPKIGFYETVKEIERRLGDPGVVLESFIVSNTPSHVMRKQWGIEKAEMTKRHVVFQDEDADTYIEAVLRA